MKKIVPFFLIVWVSVQAGGAGWLGIVVQDLNPRLAMRYGLDHREGAIVSRVQFDSPAMKGGLREGDLIVSLNGKKTPDAKTLKQVLEQTPPGSGIELIVIRNRKETTLDIVLGSTPRDAV